ncbi:MAG: CapA family protein, partial [Candidatus Moraniibacteriota bacterium]
QSSEVYKNKKIYYSLGNFVFDQYFQKETMEGLGVELTVSPDLSMEFSELKFEMTRKGQTIFKVKP